MAFAYTPEYFRFKKIKLDFYCAVQVREVRN